MKKLLAGLIAGISVLALTLIAVLLPPETFLQLRWKIGSASLGLCAVISMILQGMWAKQDEDAERKEREADEKERQRLYDLVRNVVAKLEKRRDRLYPRRDYGPPEPIVTDTPESVVNVLMNTTPTTQKLPHRASRGLDDYTSSLAPERKIGLEQPITRNEAFEQLEGFIANQLSDVERVDSERE